MPHKKKLAMHWTIINKQYLMATATFGFFVKTFKLYWARLCPRTEPLGSTEAGL